MFMIPYETPYYFVFLAILLIPYVVMMLLGKRMVWYQTLITLFFLYISFAGPHIQQGIALILYLIWQTVLIMSYLGYRKRKNSGVVFYLAVVLAILPLAISKIFPILHIADTLFAFLGISYLTFKSVQMIMETRDGLIKEINVFHLLQFLVFFPTISSGPIDRFRRFEKELNAPVERVKYIELLDKGTFYIFLGFLYNFLISYIINWKLMPHLQGNLLLTGSLKDLLLYMYAYGFNLFFNFAGYSLFAVGTSYLLGYETPMNFHYPFRAESIKDFWNRWHMSLSFWFRDYVYMRLTYLMVKKRWFKNRVTVSNLSYLGLFLLMGLWHGLTWYYVAYGLYHATLIIINDAWIRYKKKRKDKLPSNLLTRGLSIFITFHAVMLGFLIFSGILDKLWFK
ncbi:membrane protein involved in D-alanine export [Pilibacter termitis]|uniref:Teichoic acid D-alanyltransferase n=1 Tax=Pilibacter termitis TaxID=263852 RepID=A0A1T4M710_9ENTE|nr:D-alanyl-lipoteichoic acid biosynthesis protein DltB [Pilibacter termitis]SJZ62646.1 membrane protein involved in D-alanine export [Pilibacter termitis]